MKQDVRRSFKIMHHKENNIGTKNPHSSALLAFSGIVNPIFSASKVTRIAALSTFSCLLQQAGKLWKHYTLRSQIVDYRLH